MDLGLQDATAVVVGGGRGMGLATARCLADDGARVFALDVRPPEGGAAEEFIGVDVVASTTQGHHGYPALRHAPRVGVGLEGLRLPTQIGKYGWQVVRPDEHIASL